MIFHITTIIVFIRFTHLFIIRKKLLDRAESSAIDCFAKNLRQLLLTAPVKGQTVLAIDPGYSSGCKCALVDANGIFLAFSLPTSLYKANNHMTKRMLHIMAF